MAREKRVVRTRRPIVKPKAGPSPFAVAAAAKSRVEAKREKRAAASRKGAETKRVRKADADAKRERKRKRAGERRRERLSPLERSGSHAAGLYQQGGSTEAIVRELADSIVSKNPGAKVTEKALTGGYDGFEIVISVKLPRVIGVEKLHQLAVEKISKQVGEWSAAYQNDGGGHTIRGLSLSLQLKGRARYRGLRVLGSRVLEAGPNAREGSLAPAYHSSRPEIELGSFTHRQIGQGGFLDRLREVSGRYGDDQTQFDTVQLILDYVRR